MQPPYFPSGFAFQKYRLVEMCPPPTVTGHEKTSRAEGFGILELRREMIRGRAHSSPDDEPDGWGRGEGNKGNRADGIPLVPPEDDDAPVAAVSRGAMSDFQKSNATGKLGRLLWRRQRFHPAIQPTSDSVCQTRLLASTAMPCLVVAPEDDLLLVFVAVVCNEMLVII
jgi:hypothetical protein